jgi:hypothetical protein
LSLLIIPYFIWCSFATYLSTMLIILNWTLMTAAFTTPVQYFSVLYSVIV